MTLQRRGGKSDSPQWIAVFITHNLPEAHIVLGRLRAHDIPAMLHQEAGAAAIGITLGNLGEIKVLVSPADAERAADLIYADARDQLEDSNDKVRLIWDEDGSPPDQAGDDDD